MERINPQVLLLGAHAAIAGCASLLLRSALSRLAPRSHLGQGLIHLFPVICAVLGVYLFAGASQAATLLTATAVAAILFANGFAIIVRPPHDGVSPASSPMSLVLPVAAVLLLSGFASAFTTASLIGLALVGLLGGDVASSQTIGAPHLEGTRRAVLTTLVAIVPALVIVGSARQFSSALAETHLRVMPEAFLVCVLGPLTLFPLIGHTTHEAAEGRLNDALGITSTFAVLLLGICLPLLVGSDYLLNRAENEFARPIALPATSWRLDVPMLMAGGFALLGARIGLLPLHRWVGLLMVTLYGAYLLMATILRIG